MKKLIILSLFTIGLLHLTGCKATSSQSSTTSNTATEVKKSFYPLNSKESISGTIRITPPDKFSNAELTVLLEDVSTIDAPSTVISVDVIELSGYKETVKYHLPFDSTQIISGQRLNLRANIKYNDKLLYITDKFYPLTSVQNQTIDLNLIKLH